MTRSGQPMSPESLQRAQQHLMAWMQLQQRTIVVNQISKVASDVAAPYKILACPVRHPSERVMGVLALFNPPSAPGFRYCIKRRIAELLAKKATIIIQAQYDHEHRPHDPPGIRAPGQPRCSARAPPRGRTCILYLDIDRLHVINETFGMHVGDDVIVSVAERMAKTLPRGRAVGAHLGRPSRGADARTSSMDAAAGVAEEIRAAAAAIVPRAGQGALRSVGVPRRGADRPIRTMRWRMRWRPRRSPARRRRIAAATASRCSRIRDQSIIRRHTDILVIGKLREALANDRFRLDAQPILPLRGNYGRPRFELLIRMLGDRGEIIPPGKFLSAAERYQLMPTVDRWVVHRACELLGEHSARCGEEIARFAINLSGPIAAGRIVPRIRHRSDHSTAARRACCASN